MSFFITCSKIKRNHRYIIFASIFAFLTNYIFGFVYNDKLKLFIFITTDVHKKLSYHIIYHYIFRFLGILLVSLIKYNNGKLCTKKIIRITLLEPKYSSSFPIEEKDLNIPAFNLFILITILALHDIFEDIYYKSNLKVLDFWMFELPLISFLNNKISGEAIYLHHKLVIYINIFFFIIYKFISIIIYIITASNYNNFYYKIKKNR